MIVLLAIKTSGDRWEGRGQGRGRESSKVVGSALAHNPTRPVGLVVVAAIGTATPSSDGNGGRRSVVSAGGRCFAWGCRVPIGSGSSLFQVGPRPQFVLEDVFSVCRVLLHDDEFAVVNVAEVLEVFDRPVVPWTVSVCSLQFAVCD